MINFHRAVNELTERHGITAEEAKEYAHTLANAGLLAPDLPPADTGCYELDWIVPHGYVETSKGRVFIAFKPVDLTATDAETIGLSILAAARAVGEEEQLFREENDE